MCQPSDIKPRLCKAVLSPRFAMGGTREIRTVACARHSTRIAVLCLELARSARTAHTCLFWSISTTFISRAVRQPVSARGKRDQAQGTRGKQRSTYSTVAAQRFSGTEIFAVPAPPDRLPFHGPTGGETRADCPRTRKPHTTLRSTFTFA